MIRTVLIPDKNFLKFNIPDKYVGKKVEVIVFMVDDDPEETIKLQQGKKNFSVIKLKTTGFKFNREEANER